MMEGLMNICESAKKHGVERVVYISSSMVYGDFEDQVEEEPARQRFATDDRGFRIVIRRRRPPEATTTPRPRPGGPQRKIQEEYNHAQRDGICCTR
jgi:nucleoside-diphosphate-sugar epimerase